MIMGRTPSPRDMTSAASNGCMGNCLSKALVYRIAPSESRTFSTQRFRVGRLTANHRRVLMTSRPFA